MTPTEAVPEMVEKVDWRDDHRRGWVANSLKAAAAEMRANERAARARFRGDGAVDALWRAPAASVADVYAEAAALFERRLYEIAADDSALSTHKGEG